MIPRYTRPEMGRIWTPERRYRIWLDVELAACEAMVRLGEVPPEDFERSAARSTGMRSPRPTSRASRRSSAR